GKTDAIATARKLLGMPASTISDATDDDGALTSLCPCCGGRMRIIETFNRGQTPRQLPYAISFQGPPRYPIPLTPTLSSTRAATS
ncbi:MAG TPA: hypothetical protein VGJ20_06255, partial [Xanthobacteraceae bacterium]